MSEQAATELSHRNEIALHHEEQPIAPLIAQTFFQSSDALERFGMGSQVPESRVVDTIARLVFAFAPVGSQRLCENKQDAEHTCFRIRAPTCPSDKPIRHLDDFVVCGDFIAQQREPMRLGLGERGRFRRPLIIHVLRRD